jgi:hypothetical protein
MENQKNEWKGVLNREKLFVGSKSEGLYPVLSGSDGMKYRVHVKGDGPKYKSLEPFEGKQVCMLATQDNLRGHKRLVVEFVSTETLSIIEEQNQTPDPSQDSISEKESLISPSSQNGDTDAIL